MPEVRNSAARSSIGILLTRIISIPLVIVISILVARILGPTDRGSFAFLLIPGVFALPLLSMGFGSAIIYSLASGKFHASSITLSCLLMGLLFGSLVTGIFSALWTYDMLGETARQIPANCFWTVMIAQPLNGAQLMATRIPLGTGWYFLHNSFTIIGPVIRALLLLIFVVVFQEGLFGASLVLAIHPAIMLIGLVAIFGMRYTVRFNLSWAFIRQGVGYGLRGWVGNLAVRANLRADQLILGIYHSPQALGLYSIAVSVTEILWMITDAAGIVLFVKVSSLKDEDARRKLISRIHRLSIFITFSMAIVLFFVSWRLIPLVYGSAYAESAWYVCLLLPGTIAMTTPKVLAKYFSGGGRPEITSIIQATGAILSIALYLLLIPGLGAYGAAIGASLGYMASAICGVIVYKSRVRPDPARLFFIGVDDARWIGRQISGAVLKTAPSNNRLGNHR